MPPRTRIKICCIADEREASQAVRAGADALGLVSEMPSGPGPIPDEAIAHIARGVPPSVATLLLTSRTDPEAVVAHARQCGTTAIQLVDSVPVETYAALREALPALRIVQVVHVCSADALGRAAAIASHVDALLLDSGRPNATVKTLGGTGQTHDWSVSARVVRAVDVPVFLAGGLSPSNVAEAIAQVRPFGVDACSRLRSDDALDAAKVAAFVRATRSADAELAP